MMHADLIDEQDLLGQLRSLGFEVSGSAEQACTTVVCGLNETNARALKGLVEKLYTGSATILPAVRQAIDQQLLPGLAQLSKTRRPEPEPTSVGASLLASFFCEELASKLAPTDGSAALQPYAGKG